MPMPNMAGGGPMTALRRESPPADAAHARLDSDLTVSGQNVADLGLLDYEDADGRTYEERLETRGRAVVARNNLEQRYKRERERFEEMGLSDEEIEDRLEDVDDYRYRSLELQAGEIIPLELAEHVMPGFSDQLTFFDSSGVKLGDTVERIDV